MPVTVTVECPQCHASIPTDVDLKLGTKVGAINVTAEAIDQQPIRAHFDEAHR